MDFKVTASDIIINVINEIFQILRENLFLLYFQEQFSGNDTAGLKDNYWILVSIRSTTFLLLNSFICLFLAVLGLHWWAGFSLAAETRRYSPVAVLRLLTAVASLVAEHGL